MTWISAIMWPGGVTCGVAAAFAPACADTVPLISSVRPATMVAKREGRKFSRAMCVSCRWQVGVGPGAACPREKGRRATRDHASLREDYLNQVRRDSLSR